MKPDARLREVAAQLLEWLGSDEGMALDRLCEILAAARADPVIAKSKHVKELVEYLADVAEHRWSELLNGDGVAALREVANERSRRAAARPRNPLTRDDLIAFRKAFVAKHGHDRGWQTSAQAEFGIGAKAIRRRMRP